MKMRTAISIVLSVLAVLALLPIVALLESLPIEIADHEREPEDLYLLVFWLVICTLFATTCVVGVLTGIGPASETRRWRDDLLAGAAMVIGAALLVASIFDSFDRLILGLAGSLLTSTGLGLIWLRTRGNHAA